MLILSESLYHSYKLNKKSDLEKNIKHGSKL